MAKFEFTANSKELMELLNLEDNATSETFMRSVRNLKEENTTLLQYKVSAEKELTTFRLNAKSSIGKQVQDLLDGGVREGKITVSGAKKLQTQYADKPAELKDLLDDMQVYVPLEDRINVLPKELKDLADKDYDYLNKNNKLELLKKHAPDLFNEKYKAKFGKEYKGK